MFAVKQVRLGVQEVLNGDGPRDLLRAARATDGHITGYAHNGATVAGIRS